MSLVPVSGDLAQRRTRRWISYLALAVGIFCIAWSAIFVRWAGVTGSASAFYRVLVATLVLVPCRLWRGGRTPLNRRAVMLSVLAGVFFAFDLALFNGAVLRTSAANATLLGNNTPVIVGLCSWLIFGKRPRSVFWAGLILALIGSATIALGSIFRHVATGAPTLTVSSLGSGDAMAITASVFFAAYLMSIERVRSGMDTLTLTTLAVGASTATLLLLCVWLRVPLWGYAPRSWLTLAALGLVSQVGGYLAITYALGHLPATVTSVGLLAQAPLTALLAIPLLGEPLAATQAIGGVMVLAGIYVVNSRTNVGEYAG